jgi:hypothetical protein
MLAHQVSRRRRRSSNLSADRQSDLLEPARLAVDGSDEPVDPLDRPGQEDERSYLLSS